MNIADAVNENYKAMLVNGTKKELEKYLDKIDFQVYLAQTDTIKSYRNYKHNLDENNGSISIEACEDMIKSCEEKLNFFMTRKREIENALLNR